MTRSPARRTALAALLLASLAGGCKKNKPDPTPGSDSETPAGSPSTPTGVGPGAAPPPPGWSEARDTVGGYRVLLLGKASQVNYANADWARPLQQTTFNGSFRDPNADVRTKSESILPPPGAKLGTSPDELYAALRGYQQTIDTVYLPPEKTPITLGGRPGLKVVLRQPMAKLPPPPADDPPALKHWQDEAETARKNAGRRVVYLLTATATRFIIIEVKTPAEPDPSLLKTMADSFAFL